jgi:tetratricopeptide (TPR) repeat protein
MKTLALLAAPVAALAACGGRGEAGKHIEASLELQGRWRGAIAEYDEAIRDYGEAIRIDPELAAAYNNRSVAYDDLGQPQRAIADYGEAIRLDPNLAQAYSNRGNLYLSLGDYQRAVQDLGEAINLDPQLA